MWTTLAGSLGALAVAAALWQPVPAKAGCSPDAWLAQICWTAATYCPSNYAEAKGQILTTKDYPLLSTILGEAYNVGSVAPGSFMLPNLQGRSMVGTGRPWGGDYVTLGEQFGKNEMTLTLDQMPGHTHEFSLSEQKVVGTLKANSAEATEATATGNYPATYSSSASPPFATSGTKVPMLPSNDQFNAVLMGAGETLPAGKTQPFESIAPRLGLTPCIAIKGDQSPKW